MLRPLLAEGLFEAIGPALDALDSFAAAAQRFAADSPIARWKDCLSQSLAGGASKVHAMVRRWAGDYAATVIPADAADALVEVRAEWAQQWHQDQPRAQEALQVALAEAHRQPPPPPVTVEHLSDAICKVPKRSAAGPDGLHPAVLHGLSPPGLLSLAGLLSHAAARHSFPASLAGPRVAMLPRPTGGLRPISILPLVYRVYARVCGPSLAAFDAANAGDWDLSRAGYSAESAMWDASSDLELARSSGHAAYSLQVDLRRFFDGLDLPFLVDILLTLRMPAHWIAKAVQQFAAPRIIVLGGVAAPAVQPGRGICAGDPFGPTMARFVLRPWLAQLIARYPAVAIRQYMDDIVATCTGPPAAALISAQECFADTLTGLADQGHVISTTKTCVLAAKSRHARHICGRLAVAGFPVAPARATKDLGISNALARRRSTKVAWKRIHSGSLRAHAVRKIVDSNKKSRALVRSNVLAKSTWGLAVCGASPPTTRCFGACVLMPYVASRVASEADAPPRRCASRWALIVS